ncbi:MAG: ATP-binding protein [Candidatus Methanoperedens sp.]|nr:ATP-binding protein [Candidatus Methanoperedens sp.]
MTMDLTEHKKAEDENRYRSEGLAAMLKVSHNLSTTLDMGTVMQTATDSITEFMGLKSAAIYLLEEDSLYLWATTPPLDPQIPDTFRRAPLSDHPHIRESISTGKPVLLPDTATANLTPAERVIAEARGLRSILYMPLIVEMNVMGVLIAAIVEEPHVITESEIDMCCTLANMVSLTIQNVQLYESVKHHAIDLEQQVEKRKQVEKALHKAHGELEIRVKERTAQLEEANKKLKAEITERTLMEDALSLSEERYRTMIEHSNDMIWTLDTEGYYQFVNKRVEEFSGLKLDYFRGKSFTSFIDKKDLPKVIDCFHKALNGESQQYEVSVKKEDGSNFFLLVNTAPIYSKENVVGTVSFGRDINDRKKEEETRIENERLLISNKIKSVFIATMNHELRTPLTSIIGFSELLKDKTITGELNEKQEHFVDKVLSNSNHLLELINDLLDLSKIEAGKTELVIEEFSVPAAIDEVVVLIKEIAAKGNITIINNLEPLNIEADKKRFMQIILNLLNNAVKFSKLEGGIVTIAAKKSGDMAQISVSDTGIGIKKEDVERLFCAFEQLDSGDSRNYCGTGLGLIISKQLVELHGGTIEVESKYGEGSNFTFSLPMKHLSKQQIFG